MEKSTPREKRHARTKQAILDAAREILVEQGPEGLSMRELAQRIEYSPSGLYEYFKGKDEILGALCDEGFVNLTAYLNRVSGDLPPADRLVRAALAYLDFAVRNPEYYLLMFVHKLTERDILAETNRNSAYSVLRQIIQDGIANGSFKQQGGYGLEEITYGCWTLVHGMAMLRLTLFKQEGAEIDALNRSVIGGFVANLQPS